VSWCGFSIWKSSSDWIEFLWFERIWCEFYCEFLMSFHQNHANLCSNLCNNSLSQWFILVIK
jgi:hypothetical protein